MNEAWRELQVGDRVRIVRLPTELTLYPDEELEAVYQALIDVGTVLIIEQIDEYGKPWVGWDEGEGKEWHRQWLALNDDSWERWGDDEKT